MTKVSGYGAYRTQYYDSTVQNKKEQETKKTDKTEESGRPGKVQLSDKAQALLKELQKTYKNMDFMVADYDSDEEAASYLSRGTKEYSVLLDPELLEEMAADEDTKNQQLGLLEKATTKLSDMKAQLGDKKDEVTHVGVAIDKDGTMSFFAELEKSGERQRERIEKSRETRREEAAQEKKEKSKRTRVEADSVEELLDKIRNVDWRQIREEEHPASGGRIDFSA